MANPLMNKAFHDANHRPYNSNKDETPINNQNSRPNQ